MSAFSRAAPVASEAPMGILLALLAAVSFAATGFVAKQLVGEGTPGVVVALYEALFGLTFIVSIHLRRSRRSTWAPSSLRWVLLASVAYAGALGSFYTALSRIDYSAGAPILGAAPLVSYAAALLLLHGHERITRRALTGAVLIAAGVGLIGATG